MKEIGDKKLITTWAHSGEKQEPTNEKKGLGWFLGEQPPRNWMNFLQNESPKKINYLLLQGLPEWDEETPYVIGSFVKQGGKFWKALQDNTNSDPSVPGSDWEEFSIGLEEWNDSKSYVTGDFLAHNGAMWIALDDNTNSEPALNNVDWQRYPSFSLNKWDALVTYSTNDFVVHEFEIWRSLGSNTNSEPALDNSNWSRYPRFSIEQFSFDKTYFPDEFVFVGGSIWKSLTTNTGQTPSGSSTDWERYPDFSIDRWSSGQTYSENDFVYQDGIIWRSTTNDNNTGPSFVNFNWERYPNFSLNEWQNNIEYQIDDIVFYQGLIYRALTNNSDFTPSTNPSDWASFLGGTSEATPDTIVLRDANAQAKFGTPTHEQHVLRPVDGYTDTTLTDSDFTNHSSTFLGTTLTPAMGQYIKLELGSSTSNRVLSGFGDQCPVGWTVTIDVVRQEPQNSTSFSNQKGGRKSFRHLSGTSTTFGRFDMGYNRRLNGSVYAYHYTAYPDASDKKSRALCLNEVLTFQYIGIIDTYPTWALRRLPNPAYIRHGTNPNTNGFVSAHMFPDGVVDHVWHRNWPSGVTTTQYMISTLADFGTTSWGAQGHMATTWSLVGTNSDWFSAFLRDDSARIEVGTSNDSSGQTWIGKTGSNLSTTRLIKLWVHTLWKTSNGE